MVTSKTSKKRNAQRTLRKTTRASTARSLLKSAILDLQENLDSTPDANIKAVECVSDKELRVVFTHANLQENLKICIRFQNGDVDQDVSENAYLPKFSLSISNTNSPLAFKWAIEGVKLEPIERNLHTLTTKIRDALINAASSLLRNNSSNCDGIAATGPKNKNSTFTRRPFQEDTNTGTDYSDETTSESDDDYESDSIISSDESDVDSRHVFCPTKNRFQSPFTRFHRDHRAVAEAGYELTILQGKASSPDGLLMSISAHTARLQMSPEMRIAWGLKPHIYIVLLIRICGQYVPYESLLEDQQLQSNVSFRIGKCTKPVLDATEAAAAFNQHGTTSYDVCNFSKMLISDNLEIQMKSLFWKLAQLRNEFGISWDDAYRQFFSPELVKKRKHKEGSASTTGSRAAQCSFPLIAMQFALDQLIRCKTHCPICHQKLAKSFEAVRPTVCASPFCLYLRMSVGLGPSLEYEIISQPRVVELLVNCCYAALPEFPSQKYIPGIEQLLIPDAPNSSAAFSGTFMWDASNEPNFFWSTPIPFKFQAGQWTTLQISVGHGDPPSPTTNDHPLSRAYGTVGPLCSDDTIAIRFAQIRKIDESKKMIQFEKSSFLLPLRRMDGRYARLEVHGLAFSGQGTPKPSALRQVLNTLPPISKLRGYLALHPHDSIASVPGVTPQAAIALRWIVATNRSCIMEMQREHQMQDRRPDAERIQFCLVQGPPEAEVAFRRALSSVVASHQKDPSHAIIKYPTIFGWHGSPLHNWHSILKTGLNYDQTLNGRSFGNGVYFSNHFSTSSGYSGVQEQGVWPQSEMTVLGVTSLNEIINNPSQFVSNKPHYVLKQSNWHRCRYLFAHVKLGPLADNTHLPASYNEGGGYRLLWTNPPDCVVQDPSHLLIGPAGGFLQVPAPHRPIDKDASRLPDLSQGSSSRKRQKTR